MIAHMARVSNPQATESDPAEKLIQYLIKHKHWSPFEMACMCVEIETTRDIGRQILRHRSFHFQEFSQRYAEVLDDPEFSGARLQDHKNRQNSLPCEDEFITGIWEGLQEGIWEASQNAYKTALKYGIAKELARKLLPEGLTRTRMYMQGTLRDWLHYVSIRAGTETQLEHREVANRVLELIRTHCPMIYDGAYNAGILPLDVNLEPISTGPIR